MNGNSFVVRLGKIDYDYLQIDRFAKIGNGRYTMRNCNKNNYIECTPETKPF